VTDTALDVLLDELRGHCARATRSVQRIVDALGGEPRSAPLLAILGERVSSLLGELAWELGDFDLDGPSAAITAGSVLDHVGIAVEDLGTASRLYGDVLGGEVVAGGVHPGLGVRSLHFAYPGGSKIELLQPLTEQAHAHFLSARGEGVHHLTFLVPDLAPALEDLKRGQFKVVGIELDDAWSEAYVSPRSAQGCVVQLVASPDGMARADGVTLRGVLADEWEWVDHRPERVQPTESKG
jgi:methylmalonyl-CoA/ethylmalonyl-CoA epimerase